MLDLSDGFSWFVPLAVFATSFLGSPHCVVMCGPLALNFASDQNRANQHRMWSYQIGRFISYTSLGFLAGAFGEKMLSTFRSPWAAAVGLLSIGIFLVALGLRSWQGRSPHLALPKPVSTLINSIWKNVRRSRLSPSTTAGISGLLTIFLPCGHLYSFVFASAATGSPLKASVFMAAFWLGTVPALGFGAQWFRNWLNDRSIKRPHLSGALLVLAGLISLAAFATHLLPGDTTHETHSKILNETEASSHPKHLRCH